VHKGKTNYDIFYNSRIPGLENRRNKCEIIMLALGRDQMMPRNYAQANGWKIKYYKGLGTSTAQEAKEYFSNLPKHLITFHWEDGKARKDVNICNNPILSGADDCIDMAFSKKRANDRKDWLR
jgi:DNA topoisomerase-2